MREAPEIDYADAAARCPVAFLAECRRDAPVVKLTSPDPTRNGYMVTRNKDIVAVARDTATYSSIGNPQSDGWAGSDADAAAIYRDAGWPLERVLVWVDPPEHSRFRRHVDKIFAPSRVAARAGHISLCIDKLIGRFAAGGAIDGIADFARSLPAMVMTREFAASEDDFQLLIDTVDCFGRTIEFTQDYGKTAKEIAVEAAEAATRFQQYMAPRIAAVRETPTNTMLSELVNAREGDEPALTERELHSILIIFLIAATHSTTGMLGWALQCLCEQQAVQARLRREPDKIEAFVEETLRLHGTVATSFRTTTRAVDLEGVALPAGAQVFLRWDSGNRDAEKWEDPERFDIDRKGIRNHMTFGSGVHFCVGNTLARKEITMTIAALLDRFGTIELAGGPTRLESFGLHALTALPMRLAV